MFGAYIVVSKMVKQIILANYNWFCPLIIMPNYKNVMHKNTCYAS